MRSKLPIQKIRLSNKAVILIEENHATPLVSFCAYFQGGSRLETKEKKGLAHLTQRLLLKGTKKFSAEELAFRAEAIGCAIHPFTEKDAFGGYVSVLSKHLDEALELFFEVFFHPTFPEEEVEKEKALTLAQIEESRDDIYSRVLQLCDEALFGHHPYGFPILGTLETVPLLTRQDLVEWHEKWYHPNNLIFCVVGDVEADRVAEKAAAYLEPLAAIKFPKFVLPSKNGDGRRELVEEREKRQLAIALGFFAPPATDESRFTCEVLNGLLSGMGSRLFIELRDKKGLAYSVASRYESLLDYGVLKAYMGTSAQMEKAAKEGLLEELFRLRDTVADNEELERTKRYLIGLYEIGKQKNSTQALRFARYEMLGLGWRMAGQYPKKIEAVEAKAVRDLANRYLHPEKFSCAIVRPLSRN
jgi:zinc protease